MPDRVKLKAIHTLLSVSGLEDQKESLVMSYTDGRETSSKKMTDREADKLIACLQSECKRRRQPMRNKIIHKLCLMGYVKEGTDTPDYDRINNYIQNIGNRNPKKKILNYLTYHELQQVVTQVESRYRKELKK